MTVLTVIALLLVGFVGGVWNAVAGGATLFTFPALIAMGLPPIIANATNYLALLPSNMAALPAYWPELKSVGRALLPMTLCSTLGAIVGAYLLSVSDPSLFLFLIPFLILIATLLFAFGDKLRAKLIETFEVSASRYIIFAFLFIASIYGGYFGAGLGIILLAVAQFLGYSQFNTANAIKNYLASAFSLASIAIFGVAGLIDWSFAAVVMIGSTTGGYFGGHFAKHVNELCLRGFVICFGVILTIVYFVKYFTG